VTLEHVLALIGRRWLPLLLCLAAGIGGGLAHTAATPKSYQSSARVFINIPAASNPQEALQGVQLSQQLIKSYADIVTSRSTAAQVRNRLNLPLSVAAVEGKLTATTAPDTLLLTISATDKIPAQAQAIAQTAATILNDRVHSLEQDRQASSAIEVQFIDNANLPGSPTTPRPVRDLVLGLLLGLLGGVLLALLLDGLDRTTKNTGDVERLLGAPPLGVVPRVRNPKRPALANPASASAGAEAYRALRTAVRFIDPDNPLRSLVITSAGQDEGKTTVAMNLALALARGGERVILVDADLRQAGLTTMLKLDKGPGLTGVLAGGADIDAALQPYLEEMSVLPSGVLPPNPAELLGSQRMANLIASLTERADIVVFDAPPVLPVTDAVVLSTLADGAALVVRHGKTNRGHVSEARRRLAAVDANVAGFVFNGSKRPGSSNYYAPTTIVERTRTTVLPVEA
jgi:capsular exopolysaccharide synthesis family protein